MRTSDRERFFKSTVAQAYNAARKRTRACLFPGCKTSAIASHSQQKERELRAIAEDGHVYAVTPDFPSAVGNTTPSMFTKQGLSRVTTFPGFCQDHDGLLFRSIDAGELAPSEVRAAAYGFRALAHEMRRKEIMLETLWVVVPKIGDALGLDAVEPLIDQAEGIKLALENEVSFYANEFGAVATGAEANRLSFLWLTVTGALGISCTCAMSLLFKEQERRRLAGEQSSEWPVVAVSIVPDGPHTHVIATWCRADDRHSEYLRSELSGTANPARLAVFLNRLAFAESESTTIRPSLWESLGMERQERAVRCVREIYLRSHVPDAELPDIITLSGMELQLHVFP